MISSLMSSLIIIVEQILLHLPLMIGAYISMSLLKVPDLSIESAYVFGAIVGARMALATHAVSVTVSLPLIIIASIIGGALVGLVSSMLTTRLRIPHLLSSLITIGLFHGIDQYVLGAYLSLNGVRNLLAALPFFSHHPELPVLALIGVLSVVSALFMLRSQLGYALAVYGNNPDFFTHYGISTRYIICMGIVISNALAGLSGYLFAQSNGFVELNMGMSKPLLCISALMLGKTIARSTRPFTIAIPVLGTAAYFVISQLLLKINFNLKYFTAVQAGIVLIILAMHYRTQSVKATNNLGL